MTIARDRLSELKPKYDLEIIDIPSDIPEASSFLDSFYSETSAVEANIQEIHTRTDKLTRVYREVINCTETDIRQELKSKSASMSKEINKLIGDTKTRLDKMQMDMRKSKLYSAEYRIREGQIMVLLEKFQNAMSVYNKANADFTTEEEESYKRQLRGMNVNLTDEQVAELVQNMNIEELQQRFFLNATIPKALYETAKETRDDLLRLEESMNEVVELFRDLNILVRNQQSVINNIAYNVERSVAYSEAGLKNIRKARKMKKKCIIS